MNLTFLHDPLFYSTVTSQSRAYTKPLWERRDVIEKAVLRSIKRFYLQEFKKDNEKIVNKRYKQANDHTILRGFKKTCIRLFGDIPQIHEISQFLMIVSSIKPSSKCDFSKEIQRKASFVNSVMYKFSITKWKKIFEIEELGFVFKYVYKNHPEFLFQAWKSRAKELKQKCAETLDHWMIKFIQRGM